MSVALPLRIGTRPSPLARAQAVQAAERLGHPYELVPIHTSGDAPDRLAASGDASNSRAREDKGRFVKELELALLEGRIDIAVHSAKDVPSELPVGLVLAGSAGRGDPRDVLVGARSLDALPRGARIGTSSLRRRAQLLALRPDLMVVPLRGNVDTRLRRLEEGTLDALVLAAAGLTRLGLDGGAHPLPTDTLLPAPGQGTLVFETRADDEAVLDICRTASDERSWIELSCERALVRALDASCDTPFAALATLDSEERKLSLEAWAGASDGSVWLRDRWRGPAAEPEAIAQALAERLLAAGAREAMRGELPAAPGA